MSYYTEQEIDILTTAIAVKCKNIDSLILSKLNANKYNSDISGVVIIEGSQMIVMFTVDSMEATGITKLLNKIESITNLILCTERMSTFTSQNITEISNIISKTSKLMKCTLWKNAVFAKAVKSYIDYLTKSITFKTVGLLNTLNIRCFDFTYKSDKPAANSQETNKHHWCNFFSMLKRNVDLKALNLSGIAINEGTEEYLSCMLNQMTTLEKLTLEECFLKVSLKFIQLQRTTTLKYLNLSHNHLTDIEPIIAILECNTNLEVLIIDKNCLQESGGHKLGIAIENLRKLKMLCLDENIISKNITIAITSKLTTAFSATADERLCVCINHREGIEAICAKGSLHNNVTTLILCKSSVKKEDASFLVTISKTGVVLSLWQQDDALSRAAGFTRLLSAFKIITTIELVNVSCRTFTEQEENAIANIIEENTQLENVLLGSQSYNSVIEDMHAFYSAYNIDSKTKHDQLESTLKNIKASLFLSRRFLLKLISALQYHTKLKTLDLSFCPITKELAKKLAIMLAISTKLEILLLGDCSLGNEGVKIICDSLRSITTLKHLDLSSNNITQEDQIIVILDANKRLEDLYLERNCLSSTTVNGLNVSIANLKNLNVLSIDLKLFSRDLIIAFSNNTGRTLFLYDCDHQNAEVNKIDIRGSFSNINALTLCKIPIVRTGQPLQTFMLENGSLMLWWNHANILRSESIMKFLSTFLKNITTIKLHNFSTNVFTEQETENIATIFTESVQLKNLWLGIQSAGTIIEDFSTLRKVQLQDHFKQFYPTFESQFKSAYENQLKQFILAYENQFKPYISVLKYDYSAHHLKNLIFSRKLCIFPGKLLSKILSALPYNIDLKTIDLSAYFITEEMSKQLAIVLGNSTRLEVLLLRDCSLGNKGVEIIADSFIAKKITTLKHLTLARNNITEVLPIVNILKGNTKLINVYFHQNCLQLPAGYIISVCALKLKSLEVLSIDQNIISKYMSLQLANAFTTNAKTLLFYNHHIPEVINIRCSLCNVNSLTLHKVRIVGEDQPIIAVVLENGSVLLQWSQSKELKTTGVLRFLSSFKIVTIKLINNSGNELTELEVNTIATVISENAQLEKVWLGSLSLKVINEDFAVLHHKNIIDNKDRSLKEMISKFLPYVSTSEYTESGKQVVISPEKKLFPNKLLIKVLHALYNIAGIKTLDLSGNVITEALAEQLAIVLANSTELETLLLEDCSLGDKGVRVIANSLKHLKNLDLSNNGITEDQTLAAILINNPNLQMLYLERNCLHSAAWGGLSDAIVNFKCLSVLSIDQNIISTERTLKLATIFSAPMERKLYMYNHDPQTIDVIQFKGSFKINTLLMFKFPIINEKDGPSVKTVVLENGMIVINYNVINTTGVLEFLDSFKEITTIRSCNVSGKELTELEAETTAAVISNNMQLENMSLGFQSAMTIFDDVNALPSDSKQVLMSLLHNEYCVSASEDNQPTNRFKVPDWLVPFSHESLLKFLFALNHKTNVKALDLSGNIITEELAEQLAVVLANCTKVEILSLMWCSLSSDSICVIANSLKNITTLKELSLSWGNISEVAVNCIATMIECNPLLKKVILDGNLQYFHRLLAAVTKLSNLEDLLVDYKVISKDITYELVNSLISNRKMKSLSLKNHSLKAIGIVHFEALPRSIKSLGMISGSKIDAKGSVSATASVRDNDIIVSCFKDNALASTGILKVIGAFKDIMSVILYNSTFSGYTDDDINEIATTVASFVDLKWLVMKGHTAALHNELFHSLKELNCLTWFMLSSGGIQISALDKLATVLHNNTKIQILELNDCLLKLPQAIVITNALKMHTDIISLDLHGNNITDAIDVADNIEQILLNNQNIEKIDISRNSLQAKGIIKLLGDLKQLHKIKTLSIGNNNIIDHDDTVVMTRLYDLLVEVINNNLELEELSINYICIRTDETTAKVVQALRSLSCLKLLDISGNNIAEETADNIAAVITNNSNLVRLYIADNHLGTIGISKIAKALIDPRGLQVLDIINNNITSKAAEVISNIIKSNPQLNSLLLGEQESPRNTEGSYHNEFILNEKYLCSGLSMVKLSDRFINKQIMEIKEHSKKNYGPVNINSFVSCINICCQKVLALSSSNILKYSRNKLQSVGIKRICKALATIKSLEVLSIENNDVGDEAAEDIATALASNRIKQLWIGQNNFTPSGMSVILQSLLNTLKLQSSSETASKDDLDCQLQILDLSHGNLSQETAFGVSMVLSKNNKLFQQLWLENNFSIQSIVVIAEAIKNCMNILVLSLRDNDINEEAVDRLSQAITRKTNLQQLYLGNNQLEDGGVIKITEALNTTCGLLTLDLMNNNISEAAADALATVITSCRLLEQLYLGDNKLHSTGTIKIATAIQQAACRSTLRVLDLSNNGIGSDKRVADELSRAVGNTELLTVLILDDNALSVDGLLKITRSLGQSESTEYMVIFSVMRNDVMISEEVRDEMRAVMADQQLTDCVMYF